MQLPLQCEEGIPAPGGLKNCGRGKGAVGGAMQYALLATPVSIIFGNKHIFTT